MPRNGSGGYSLPVNTWSPATNGVSATAADWTALINDVAAAIQQSLSADGQTPVTGNINMGGNRLTGLAAGTATGQSLRFEQLFSQGLQQDVPAAATTDIGAQLSTLINVTGAATITSFGTNYNGPRFLRFAGVCTLTNSATLVLPGGSNITTAAGDSAIAVPLGNPATGWRVVAFQPQQGTYNATQNGQLAGMRNKIINGKMEIAQRGTTGTINSGSGPVFLADRFFGFTGNTTASLGMIIQGASVPPGNEFQRALQVTNNNVVTDLSTGGAAIAQHIEGWNARDLIGRTFTLSFWVRSNRTGTYCVSFRNSISDRSYVLEYSINAADTWEYKTLTVPGGLITAGSWNWENLLGLRVTWALAAPVASQTTPGAWQTGSFVATANQVNFMAVAGRYFDLTGVQLEVGSVATPFEHRPYGAELALCQRYYWNAASLTLRSSGNAGAGAQPLSSIVVEFPVTMRAVPTCSASTSGSTNTGTPVATITTGAYVSDCLSAATGYATYLVTFNNANAEL